VKGVIWSLMAGSAGAIGALGIIIAFANSGGPSSRAAMFVMPLVFGCAPIVNTIFTVTMYNLWGKISPFFAAGLILTATGAFLVLFNAPKPEKPSGAKPTPTPSVPADTDVTTNPAVDEVKSPAT
jgi:hypothetical protein